MTDLDDALNASNPIFHPVEVIASWRELWPNYSPGNNTEEFDDLRELGEQVGAGGYTVTHSLDDGMPDPVTLTGGGDASGQFQVELNGRPSNIADVLGINGPMPGATGSGNSLTIVASNANNVFINNSVFVGVTVPSTTTVTDNQDLEDRYRWKLLSSVTDGPVKLLVYYLPVYYSGAPSLILSFTPFSTYAWVGVSALAGTYRPASAQVPIWPDEANIKTMTETVSQTTHTMPDVYLKRRGWVLTFWATDTANAFSTTTMTEISESTGAPRIMMAWTSLKQRDWTELGTNMMAVTASATANVAGVAVPLQVMDRPAMDALQYFSPFNKDSPLYGWDRDTAPVTVSQPVISPNGPVSTQLFSGTMVDIPVSGRTVTMQAVSQGRLDVDRVLDVPLVRVTRGGSSLDWMVAYILAHGRQFIGPKASAYTRLWAPMYGSIEPFVNSSREPTLDYPGYSSACWRYTTANPGVLATMQQIEPPVPGPFVSGMYAHYHNDNVIDLSIFNRRTLMKGGCTQLGFDAIPDHTNDWLTQANNKGRVMMWLRGDATATSPAALTGTTDSWANSLMRFRVANGKNGTSANRGDLNLFLLENRNLMIQVGSDLDGWNNMNLTGHPLPVDGEWHQIVMTWDWVACTMNVRMDNWVWNVGPNWAPTTGIGNLPVNEEQWYAQGGYTHVELHCKVPIADFMAEAGDEPYQAGISEFYPGLDGTQSGAVTYRATMQPLDSIALDSPIQGWETLAQLALAAGAHYRMNEKDKFEFLPRRYFGEDEQMTPAVIVDTEVNASDLNVTLDPSKSRNVVTVEFDETTTDWWTSYTVNVTSAVEIPRGITDMTFPSDELICDIFGSNRPDLYFNFYKITSTQLATPSTIPNDKPLMTVNTKSDGSGTVYVGTGIRASIINWTSNSVSVRFWNTYGASLWLANSGTTEVPFLRVRTHPVRVNKSYTTMRNNGSIGARRERALSASIPWIHDRATAENMAGQMVNEIARPRPQLTVEVMMDPRRKPGDLVTVQDSQGTQADGFWRVMSVVHNGAQFTQTLQLVRVLPIAVWDGPDGWDNAAWGV